MEQINAAGAHFLIVGQGSHLKVLDFETDQLKTLREWTRVFSGTGVKDQGSGLYGSPELMVPFLSVFFDDISGSAR